MRYTLGPGRVIHVDGQPFAQVLKSAQAGEQVRPSDVDAFASEIVDKLNRIDVLQKIHEDARPDPTVAMTREEHSAALGGRRPGPYSATPKQVAYYQRLLESPVWRDDERKRALAWLAKKATRQTIKDQIDWLKRQVETRNARA